MALDFYNAGVLRQIATNLFYGWGYNFYRAENQMRADDQLIRSRSILLLNAATGYVAAAEEDYRRQHLPAPTRARPYPDPTAVEAAQKLERLAHALRGLAGQLSAQPVPENDRMSQRFRREAATLYTLIEHDGSLAARCEMLRAALENQTAEAMLAALPDLTNGLASIEAALLARSLMLHGITTHTSQPNTFNL